MDPYFTGKLIQSLNELFYKGKKAEINEVMHQYSELVKANFEALDSDTVPLNQEMSMLMQFLHTHNLMLGGKIHYELRASIHSTDTNLLVPAMLLQSLLEHALEHGIKHTPPSANYTRIPCGRHPAHPHHGQWNGHRPAGD